MQSDDVISGGLHVVFCDARLSHPQSTPPRADPKDLEHMAQFNPCAHQQLLSCPQETPLALAVSAEAAGMGLELSALLAAQALQALAGHLVKQGVDLGGGGLIADRD